MFANDSTAPATESAAPRLAAVVRQPNTEEYSARLAAVNAKNREFWSKQSTRRTEPALPVVKGEKSWMQ
jgi:hypothetical protein